MTITHQQVVALLAKIKVSYPNFVFLRETDDFGNVKSSPTADVWHERLAASGITAEQALTAVNDHIDNYYREPGISDILKIKKNISVYDIQELERQQEQLALQEYHDNNDVVPMPDHIQKKLERIAQRSQGGESGE